MAFRLDLDVPVRDGVQRNAREQVVRALAELADPELDRHEVVHQVRKRCKKVRGLLRLVRPALGDAYARENAWYRDTARLLSDARDSQTRLETLEALLEHYDATVDRESFAPVRERLLEQRTRIAEDGVGLREILDAVTGRLHEGRARIAAWELDDAGFDALAGGLAKTYARGRDAMHEAYDDPTAARFHEWRKRAKYHWYHVRLLRRIWSGPMKERASEAHELSDELGDEHDLAVLCSTVREEPDACGGEEAVDALIGLAGRRQVELRREARELGWRIYAEKPRRIVARLRAYWEAREKGEA